MFRRMGLKRQPQPERDPSTARAGQPPVPSHVKLGAILNRPQTHPLVAFAPIVRRPEDAAQMLRAQQAQNAFPRYVGDASSALQIRLEVFLSALRQRFLDIVSANAITPPPARIGVLHAIRMVREVPHPPPER